MPYEILITEVKPVPIPEGTVGRPTPERIERFKMTVDDMDMGWIIKQITAPKRKRNAKKAAA